MNANGDVVPFDDTFFNDEVVKVARKLGGHAAHSVPNPDESRTQDSGVALCAKLKLL